MFLKLSVILSIFSLLVSNGSWTERLKFILLRTYFNDVFVRSIYLILYDIMSLIFIRKYLSIWFVSCLYDQYNYWTYWKDITLVAWCKCTYRHTFLLQKFSLWPEVKSPVFWQSFESGIRLFEFFNIEIVTSSSSNIWCLVFSLQLFNNQCDSLVSQFFNSNYA